MKQKTDAVLSAGKYYILREPLGFAVLQCCGSVSLFSAHNGTDPILGRGIAVISNSTDGV